MSKEHLDNYINAANNRFFKSANVLQAQFSVINHPMNWHQKYWDEYHFIPDFLKHVSASIVHSINVLQGAFNLALSLITEPTKCPALTLALLEDVASVVLTALTAVISLISLVSRPLVSLLNWELYDKEAPTDENHYNAVRNVFSFGAVV